MSEFRAFLEFLYEIIKWIFILTLNIISTGVLLVACVVIWRSPFALSQALDKIEFKFKDFCGNRYREQCFGQLGVSILDVIVLCLVIVSLIAPTRWIFIFKVLSAHFFPFIILFFYFFVC